MECYWDNAVRMMYVPESGRPTYFLPNSSWSYMDVFKFERRRGEHRMIKQYVLPHPPAE